MRACCRPPTPTPGCTAATVDGRRSLPVPTSASCSAECHRQRGQQFGGDGPKKSFHLAPVYHRGQLPCRTGFAAHHEVPVGTNSTRNRLGRERTRRRPGVGWMSCTLMRAQTLPVLPRWRRATLRRQVVGRDGASRRIRRIPYCSRCAWPRRSPRIASCAAM